VTNFLSSILPTQGYYCAIGIRADKTRQSFHSTIEEVEEVGTGLNSQGVDAYFALASFNSKENRTASNTAFLRSFFIDLDCGQGKPYADQPEAAQALSKFITDTQLPQPTIINSGGGLHVYWPLDKDVASKEWVPYAKAFKELCKKHKLLADPVVTSDCARILRIPGTTNFKHNNSRPVQIMMQGQPVALEDFVKLLPKPPVDLSAAKQFGMDTVTGDIGGEYPVCSFARIAKRSMTDTGCAQIKHALIEAATLEEPLWRAALSIATRCKDGPTAIHKISIKHPGYTPEDTEEKAFATKGPYTCEWYRDNYPERCKKCKQTVSTPLLIGKVVKAAEAQGDSYLIEKPKDEDTPALTLNVPTYPFPYFRGENGGVYRKIQDEDGNSGEIEIYPRDLYLTERFFDLD